jgi:hypothetical protein
VKIQCLLKREGGTKIEIGGKDYHFQPQADGTHVAEVKDQSHIKRLLSIKEAYRAVDLQAPLQTTDEQTPLTPATPATPETEKTPDPALTASDTAGNQSTDSTSLPAPDSTTGLTVPATETENKDAPEADKVVEPALSDKIAEPAQEAKAEVKAEIVDDPAPAAAPLGNSETEHEALIKEAKALGINANRNWGIPRLKSEIKALKGE